VCGDAWNVVCEGHELSLMVADGLGHGPLAARASECASALLEHDTPGLPPLPAPRLRPSQLAEDDAGTGAGDDTTA